MASPDKRDLLGACMWAGATVAAVAVSDSTLLRAVLGLPMALLISGHVVLRAIGVRTTSLSEHLAYSIGASLAVTIVGGFVLNAISALAPLGWAFWYLAVAIAARLLPARGNDVSPARAWLGPLRIQPWQAAAVALAMLVATGAYALAIHDQAADRQFRYTEFWMLPPAKGDPGQLVVGVHSAEAQAGTYDLEITLDGKPFAVFRSLTIAPGDTWVRKVSVPILATQQQAEARLYRPADNKLYRRVSALVPEAEAR
ncbi:DUF1616 domain-containing protein [Bradyrhizobium sp. Ce-3]|uniref:DUF1616 domain-containing protein n=1 Tax=Bradyrhizobium sp. Ce-3 TaxID=2913970 RepID=UPI001FBBE767|nr:DUF1616 domain-containing protein [Bradyrhizobium sp. Ce-3]GKQ49673.1 hypothetical protein BRSPCE3_05270 [Bradyrhizobium sp. Ce-3]